MINIIPNVAGFYWAHWFMSDNNYELPPEDYWEIVWLYDNDNNGSFKVSVLGYEESERPENFVWGMNPILRDNPVQDNPSK